MKKSMLLFNPYLEIYRIIRTPHAIIYRLEHAQPARSFLKQWTQLIKAAFQASPEGNIKGTHGGILSGAGSHLKMNALAAQSYYGVVLGTGNTPVAINDYKLQTQIINGSGAGQLNHYAVVIDAHQVVGSTSSFRVKRQFENLSGGTITVKESGIYTYYDLSYAFDIIRDVLTTPFDIANTQIAEFRYTFKATV